MKTIKSIYLIVFLLVTGAVFAENKKPGALVRSTLKGLEYRIKAGVNIGGTSPLPLPAEIRKSIVTGRVLSLLSKEISLNGSTGTGNGEGCSESASRTKG